MTSFPSFTPPFMLQGPSRLPMPRLPAQTQGPSMLPMPMPSNPQGTEDGKMTPEMFARWIDDLRRKGMINITSGHPSEGAQGLSWGPPGAQSNPGIFPTAQGPAQSQPPATTSNVGFDGMGMAEGSWNTPIASTPGTAQGPSEEEAALQAYLQAIGAKPPTYEAPPSVMLPKIPGWLAAVMAGLSFLDPSQQVGPAIASGLVQGGQQRSQEEAARRQMAFKQAQQQQDATTQQAEIKYKVAAGKGAEDRASKARVAEDERRFKQQTDLENLRQGGRRALADTQADKRTVADETKDGMARAEAAERLNAEGSATYHPEYIAALRNMKSTTRANSEAGVANKGAQTTYTNAKTETENQTRPGKVLKFEDEHKKNEQWLRQSEKTIAKWEADTKIKQQNANTSRTQANASAKNADTNRMKAEKDSGPGTAKRSEFDKKLDTLRLKKDDILAQLESLKSQEETAATAGRISKLKTTLAGVDAQIKRVKGLGGKEGVSQYRQQAQEAIDKYPNQKKQIMDDFKKATGEDF